MTVFDIENEIKRLEKLKADIQSECQHINVSAKFNEKNSIRLFCCDCNLQLGYPNETQINAFLTNGH
jgi:hypothetical protein